MTLLNANRSDPGTVCPQARQLAAPDAGRRRRVEQLARAYRAGRLFVDSDSRRFDGRVVVDPRDVAATIVWLAGLV